MPVPEGAYINNGKKKAEVFIFIGTGPKQKAKRRVIGHYTGNGKMVPNTYFKQHYPARWSEFYGEEQKSHVVMRHGLFTAVLAISTRTGLYPDLIDSFDGTIANAILDYAMYGLTERSDSTVNFEMRMDDFVLFSRARHGDSWYSDLFSDKMTSDMCEAFKDRWLERCKEAGISEAYIAIDGSNNDCRVRGSELCGKGHAKSGNDDSIVAYMYAVAADDGTPLTYEVNYGGKIDAKAVVAIILRLASHGIRCRGILLDRGFCTLEVIELLEDKGYDWVVMLKENTDGYIRMYGSHSKDLPWDVRRMVAPGPIFGVSELGRLFAKSDKQAYINFYCHGVNKANNAGALADEVFKTVEAARRDIACNKEPSIPHKLSKYITLERSENGIVDFTVDYGAWQGGVDAKGYYAIASNLDLGPKETDRVYNLRDSPEKGFAALKTGLGFSATRVHSDEAIRSKFCVGFVAGIIRNEFVKTASRIKSYPTGVAIADIGRLKLLGDTDENYTAIHDESLKAREFLKSWGIGDTHTDLVAQEFSKRLHTPAFSTRWEIEGIEDGDLPAGRHPVKDVPQEQEQQPGEGATKRKRGRKKGQTKKTNTTQATAAQQGPKRGPGRPKGSKNKSTILKEQQAAAQQAPPSEKLS